MLGPAFPFALDRQVAYGQMTLTRPSHFEAGAARSLMSPSEARDHAGRGREPSPDAMIVVERGDGDTRQSFSTVETRRPRRRWSLFTLPRSGSGRWSVLVALLLASAYFGLGAVSFASVLVARRRGEPRHARARPPDLHRSVCYALASRPGPCERQLQLLTGTAVGGVLHVRAAVPFDFIAGVCIWAVLALVAFKIYGERARGALKSVATCVCGASRTVARATPSARPRARREPKPLKPRAPRTPPIASTGRPRACRHGF